MKSEDIKTDCQKDQLIYLQVNVSNMKLGLHNINLVFTFKLFKFLIPKLPNISQPRKFLLVIISTYTNVLSSLCAYFNIVFSINIFKFGIEALVPLNEIECFFVFCRYAFKYVSICMDTRFVFVLLKVIRAGVIKLQQQSVLL